jgi:crotonobetainyl-CoA:carnitine CoA-transferase CaiB-like acyl-CoA transferase
MPVNGDYWHMSRTPAVIGQLPKVGEHNDEVLSGILGLSEERIAQLKDSQVISESDHYDEVPG